MKKVAISLLLAAVFILVGCQSTLDKEATRLNDTMTQRVTREDDTYNASALERGEITTTTKGIRDERNHKHRRVARAMARDAGNDDLPIIPTKMENEPDWVDPEHPAEPEPEPTDPE